jgi:hypothetical protein
MGNERREERREKREREREKRERESLLLCGFSLSLFHVK